MATQANWEFTGALAAIRQCSKLVISRYALDPRVFEDRLSRAEHWRDEASTSGTLDVTSLHVILKWVEGIPELEGASRALAETIENTRKKWRSTLE